MPDVCLYFQVHQPNRLLPYDLFRIGENAVYEDDAMNAEILNKVAEKCYLPANRMFKRLIEENEGRFRMALSISGTVIEQMERTARTCWSRSRNSSPPAASSCWRRPTITRSPSSTRTEEFDRQVELHLQKLEKIFHVRPRVFRNTELIYNDAIAAKAETMGFDGIIAEGVERNLNGQSPNFLYRAPTTARIKTLLRNIAALRRSRLPFLRSRHGPSYPLTAGEIRPTGSPSVEGDVVNLFMDYETIGEHQSDETGIFEFWEAMPEALDRGRPAMGHAHRSRGTLPRRRGNTAATAITSWADAERDLSAWMGNVMQQEAIAKVHRLEQEILAVNDPELTDTWAKMQTSDHFYWMSTKGGTDGSVHKYFTPYPSPYDAYIYFMNVLADLQIRLRRAQELKGLA